MDTDTDTDTQYLLHSPTLLNVKPFVISVT
jgi:hypothetical protein